MFITLFSFSLIGVMSELNQIETLEQVLEDRIHLDDFSLSSNSNIYDANGELISEVFSSENRIYLPYSEIPESFMKAIIVTEDQHFFSHKGFDINGMIRALFVNAQQQTIEQGGSTITQQLVKNIFLNNERSYNRKLTELLYAYQVEKMFTKEEILEFYLNAIYFHNGVYGIETASQYYFAKSAKDLSIAEVAFLCAIPNNPTLYNPFAYPENTHKRKEWILRKMLEENYLDEYQFQKAMTEKINLSTPKDKIDLYPDYVTYIHDELEQLIGETEGFNQKIANATSDEEKNSAIRNRQQRVKQVLASGIHIYTALLPHKQELISATIEKQLPGNVIQAAAVIIDHRSHRLVAISGGKNYRKFNFHRGFQAYRQPGSAIKPLLVFAPYLAETRVPISTSVNAAPFCKNEYCPQNYDGAVYENVQIETAFKHSLNTAAVRMLEQISAEKGFSYLNKFGFSKIVPDDYRLSAALGGLTYGVSLLEMTTAYSTFANDGVFQRARGIEKVVDKHGKILYEWPDAQIEVWNKEVNTKMRILLNKVVTDGTGKKANIHRSYNGGKTGTTNEFHDLWFIGLNENYTTGVWVGEDLPKSLAPFKSKAPHLLIWRDLMKQQ